MKKAGTETDSWTQTWLTGVADGSLTMSQRTLARVEARPGGVAAVCAEAREQGVHLAVFTDDQDVELVVASKHPIRVLC